MKKLLLISCFLLAATFTANAQTKEETISWLQEKLTKYIYYRKYVGSDEKVEDISFSVTECLITINYKRPYNGKTYNEFFKIPTADFLLLETDIGGIIRTKAFINSIVKLRGSQEEFVNYTFFFITNSEENLLERFNKAVTHLATFCPKKKETF